MSFYVGLRVSDALAALHTARSSACFPGRIVQVVWYTVLRWMVLLAAKRRRTRPLRLPLLLPVSYLIVGRVGVSSSACG